MANERLQMREFIVLAEQYAQLGLSGEDDVKAEIEPPAEPSPSREEQAIIVELRQLSFKLGSYCETLDEGAALGVETGMQRAADMIDNLIRRHTRGE